MTKYEFLKAYRQAKRSFGALSVKTARNIQRTYISASLEISKTIRELELAGKSQLTIDSLRNLEIQIQNSADQLMKLIDKQIKITMTKAVETTSGINEKYIIDVLKDVPNSIITSTGINNMFMAINNLVIQSVVNRVFTDGYNYAQSIWNAGLKYQQEMKDIVSIGLAQNRDLIEIARDLNVYTKDGKLAFAKRYGRLTRESKEFMKRIGNRVDWRALRIARSELYMSIQDAAKEQGRINPAALDLYNWVLTAGRQDFKCDCETIAKNGPYKYEDVPAYPHPNCRCYIQPVLRDRKEFESDLKEWVHGENVQYIDEWYANFYQPLALT